MAFKRYSRRKSFLPRIDLSFHPNSTRRNRLHFWFIHPQIFCKSKVFSSKSSRFTQNWHFYDSMNARGKIWSTLPINAIEVAIFELFINYINELNCKPRHHTTLFQSLNLFSPYFLGYKSIHFLLPFEEINFERQKVKEREIWRQKVSSTSNSYVFRFSNVENVIKASWANVNNRTFRKYKKLQELQQKRHLLICNYLSIFHLKKHSTHVWRSWELT